MKDFFFLLVGIAVIGGSFYFFFQKPAPLKYQMIGDFATMRVGEETLKVEIAETPEERELGLSGRAGLAEGTGMLFIFENPGQYGFWMKEMLFPIDIVWLDESGRVVGIERAVGPETFPQTFYPPEAIKYALELPAGYSTVLALDTTSILYFDQ